MPCRYESTTFATTRVYTDEYGFGMQNSYQYENDGRVLGAFPGKHTEEEFL